MENGCHGCAFRFTREVWVTPPRTAESTLHSLLSDKFTRRGKGHSPFLHPALFTPSATSWPGAGCLAGCPSRTHALDPCWATLSAGGARLSSPWLTPAQRTLHLRVVNRSTHYQLRRQTPPRQMEVNKDAGTPSWTRAEAVAPEAKARICSDPVITLAGAKSRREIDEKLFFLWEYPNSPNPILKANKKPA